MSRVLLVLLLVLQISETEQIHSVFVGDGDEAMLICDNVKDGQDQCDGTTWFLNSVNNPKNTVELITLGQIGSSVKDRDRLRVSDDCSLLIKHVQTPEAGQYSCRQFDKSGRPLPPDAVVSLSVVSLSEDKGDREANLTCSVSTNLRCSSVEVKWLHRQKELEKNHPSYKYERFSCGASVFVSTSHYFYSSRRQRFKCEVSFDDKNYPFSFKPEEPGEPESTTKPTKATGSGSEPGQDSGTSSGFEDWWWAVPVAVATAALVSAAVVITRRRRSANPQETNRDLAADPEEGVSYASVSFGKKSHSKTRTRDEEEDTVTYSTVKTPASEGPDQLYASVNEPRD